MELIVVFTLKYNAGSVSLILNATEVKSSHDYDRCQDLVI